jgi:hypothetical protein
MKRNDTEKESSGKTIERMVSFDKNKDGSSSEQKSATNMLLTNISQHQTILCQISSTDHEKRHQVSDQIDRQEKISADAKTDANFEIDPYAKTNLCQSSPYEMKPDCDLAEAQRKEILAT